MEQSNTNETLADSWFQASSNYSQKMLMRFTALSIVITFLFYHTLFVHSQDGFDEDPMNLSQFHPDEYEGPGSNGYSDSYGYHGADGEVDETDRPNSAVELQSWSEIENFVKEAEFETSVVGFFDAISYPDDLETFQELAMTDGFVYRFAFSTNKNVLEAKKYDGCAVLVFPPPKFVNEKLERTKYRFPGKSIAGKQQLMLDFIKTKSITLTGEYTSKTREIYDSLKKPVVTVFSLIDHERNAKGYNYLSNRVRKVAKKFEGKVVFALADTDSYTHAMETDYGFESLTNKETLVGLRDGDMYYKMTDKFSVENLAAFVESYFAGGLEGRQKPPSHADEHDHDRDDNLNIRPVVPVNDDNVKEILLETSADVMVEFYAPWCGHCRSLKPEYKKVAEHFENDESITIAAFDATVGTVPENFDVQGYPTLYFVSANKKNQPIPYEGDRSAPEIIKFINSHRQSAKKGEL